MKKRPDPPVFYGPHIQQDRRRGHVDFGAAW